jgi:hypothetical protein
VKGGEGPEAREAEAKDKARKAYGKESVRKGAEGPQRESADGALGEVRKGSLWAGGFSGGEGGRPGKC